VAGGWLDCTRIAAGDAELWRQILLANRDHTLRAMDEFAKVFAQLRSALEKRDGAALLRLLEAGKQIRDAVGS
jgi:prephenate dehydrogenase